MEIEINFSRLVFALASPSLDAPPEAAQDGPEPIASLEDYHAAWTALWSPRVLGLIGFLPESRRTDTSGLDIENALIVVPELAHGGIDQPLEERLGISGNRLLFSGRRPRREIADEICRNWSPKEHHPTPSVLNHQAARLEEEFCAFGYAVMQVQQMAKKLRYSFNLDWMIVSDQLIQAANHFNQGDYEEADRWLGAAYDSLSQERDRYCSQQGNLLHLVLAAQSTLGSRFSKELENGIPTSLFSTTQTLKRLSETNPSGFERVNDRISEKSLSLVGGFAEELKHTYLTELSLHRSFLKAKSQAVLLGLEYPKVLMPFYPSIPAHLPILARWHGFEGALLAKFLDGMIPEKEHAKLKWQATSDGPTIDTILGHVIDAADPHALLDLGSAMAKQLDYHQVPTLVIAHWPDRASSVFQDLVRIMQRTPALGKWIKADEYFQTTSQPYWSDQFGPNHFPFTTPNQPQQIHSLQISLVHLNRLLYGLERLAQTLSIWSLVSKPEAVSPAPPEEQTILDGIQCVLEQLDSLASHESESLLASESWVGEFESKCQAAQDKVAELIRHWMGSTENWTIVQTAGHPRRVSVQLPILVSPPQESNSDRIVAASRLHEDPSKTQVIVDIPPFGFAKIPVQAPEGETFKPKKAGIFSKILGQRHSIAQADGSLANEFMEVQVDPKKGHLRSLHIRDQRGNRLSAMVSLATKPAGLHHRLVESDWIGLGQLTVEVKPVSDSEALIVTRGIFQTGHTPAQQPWIEQTIRMSKGCKWVEVSLQGGGFDRQSHSPVWRMVWPSESAILQMWTHGNRTKWLGPLQACTELIEIDDAQHKVYFATGGLSYHIKQGANQLQSLLPIGADGSLSARLMLGIDWQRPWETAIDLFQPVWVIPPAGGPRSLNDDPSGKSKDAKSKTARPLSAWLAQCNHPNLRFFLSPAPNQKDLSFRQADESIVPDVLVWVTEGTGKSSTARISLPKNVVAAWKVDFSGRVLDKIAFKGSDLLAPYSAWEKSVFAVILEK